MKRPQKVGAFLTFWGLFINIYLKVLVIPSYNFFLQTVILSVPIADSSRLAEYWNGNRKK